MADLIANMQAVAGAGGGEATFVEDVFSTHLYDANLSSGVVVNNGINLLDEGGLIWTKCRNFTADHGLYDSERTSFQKLLRSNTTIQQLNSGTHIQATTTGYTIDSTGYPETNNNNTGARHVSWTFRKAPKFFDVVTFTADAGSNNGTKAHAHNLGSSPGFIIIKQTNAANSWVTFHRSLAANNLMFLNATSDVSINSGYYSSVSDTHVTVGNALNENSAEYVMYLFAHNNNDGDFGETGDQDIIKCGSVTMNSSGNASITLGFEPSWVLLKRTDSASQWAILDTMRGWAFSGTAYLQPNNSNAEGNYGSTDVGEPTATGFEMKSWGANASYIYIAIRRGPMKTPTLGTEVFSANFSDGVEPIFSSGFPVDLGIYAGRSNAFKHYFYDRLRGSNPSLNSTNTSAEQNNGEGSFDNMDGWGVGIGSSTDYVSWSFRRAHGFFDVVTYEGNGVAGRTISHNLGSVPGMIIIKGVDSNYEWSVYHRGMDSTAPEDYFMWLNHTYARFDNAGYWNDTAPTSTEFTLGNNGNVNSAVGGTYVAYLFATLPGVSKVGSYTGNSSTQTIDCGFTNGARFVLIKSYNDSGDWQVFDTERGIVAGDDARLLLNRQDAESSDDYIDPHSSGFSLPNHPFTNSNAQGQKYIFLAIA